MLSFLAVATLEKIPLNLDNLCLAYPRLLYFTVFVAFQEAVATQVAAKHKTPYSFRSEVAFINFKAKLLGGLGNLTTKFTYLFTLFRH